MDDKEPEFPAGSTWLVESMRLLPSQVGIIGAEGVCGNEHVLGLLAKGIPMGHHTQYPPREEDIGVVFSTDAIPSTIIRFIAFAHYLFRHDICDIRPEFWRLFYEHHVPMDALIWLMEGQSPTPAAPDGPLDTQEFRTFQEQAAQSATSAADYIEAVTDKAAEMVQEAPTDPTEGDRAAEPAPEAQEPVQGPCLCGALAFVAQEPVRHFPGCIHWHADVAVGE